MIKYVVGLSFTLYETRTQDSIALLGLKEYVA